MRTHPEARDSDTPWQDFLTHGVTLTDSCSKLRRGSRTNQPSGVEAADSVGWGMEDEWFYGGSKARLLTNNCRREAGDVICRGSTAWGIGQPSGGDNKTPHVTDRCARIPVPGQPNGLVDGEIGGMYVSCTGLHIRSNFDEVIDLLTPIRMDLFLTPRPSLASGGWYAVDGRRRSHHEWWHRTTIW